MRFQPVRTASIDAAGVVTLAFGVLDTDNNKVVATALTLAQAQACAASLNAVKADVRV